MLKIKARKMKSKLLVYYLQLAELGNVQAEKQAKVLANELFQENQEIDNSKEYHKDKKSQQNNKNKGADK